MCSAYGQQTKQASRKEVRFGPYAFRLSFVSAGGRGLWASTRGLSSSAVCLCLPRGQRRETQSLSAVVRMCVCVGGASCSIVLDAACCSLVACLLSPLLRMTR